MNYMNYYSLNHFYSLFISFFEYMNENDKQIMGKENNNFKTAKEGKKH